MKSEDFLLFNETLKGAVSAGAPLPDGLEVFARELGRGDGASVRAVAEDLRKGVPLSEALAGQGQAFPKAYVRLVQAGEKAGNLPAVLQRVLETGREAARLQQAIEEAFAYPFILCVVLAAVQIFWSVFVSPPLARTFSEMYTEMGMQEGLPLPTVVSLWTMKHGLFLFGIPLAVLVGTLLLLRGLISGWIPLRADWERFLVWVPLAGGLFRAQVAARFCHASGLLVERGVPAPEALALSAESSGSAWMREDLATAADLSRRGTPFSDAVHAFRALPPWVLWMVRQGEARGDLGGTLEQLGRLYFDVARRRMRFFRSALVPVLMLLMGLWIGFSILALFLPLVSMMNVLGA